eukprot:scaffold23233_cov111-Isochrysis_galbana.AAC.3
MRRERTLSDSVPRPETNVTASCMSREYEATEPPVPLKASGIERVVEVIKPGIFLARASGPRAGARAPPSVSPPSLLAGAAANAHAPMTTSRASTSTCTAPRALVSPPSATPTRPFRWPTAISRVGDPAERSGVLGGCARLLSAPREAGWQWRAAARTGNAMRAPTLCGVLGAASSATRNAATPSECPVPCRVGQADRGPSRPGMPTCSC